MNRSKREIEIQPMLNEKYRDEKTKIIDFVQHATLHCFKNQGIKLSRNSSINEY